MTNNLDIALALARAGFYVFPCRQDKKPAPSFIWREWSDNRESEIEAMWLHYGADCLPALDLAKCGIIVIDLDRHRNDEGEIVDGVAAFDDIVDEHGELPACPVIRTPGNGFHLVFRQPEGREPLGNSSGGLPHGVDVRGRGGYVIACGAVVDDGRFYDNVDGCPDLLETFVAGTIPRLPAWTVEYIEARRYEVPVRSPSSTGPVEDSRARAWGQGALRGEATKLALTGKGGRNDRLNRTAYLLGGKSVSGCLLEDEVRDALWAACVTNGLIAEDGAPSFQKSFDSGWRSGLQRPLPEPRERYDKATTDRRLSGLNI